MKNRIFWLGFFIAFISFNHVAGQINVRFDKITIDQGLSHSTVFDIIQDKNGFMWFGTAEGLNRFDGYNFNIYKPNFFDTTTISDTWITSLLHDKKGQIWIGTFGGGLNVFDVTNQSFRHFTHNPNDPNSLVDNVIYEITQDSSENIWIGTNYGLSRLNTRNFTFKNFKTIKNNDKSLSYDAINSLYVDRHGTLWIGTNGGGLNRFNPSEESFTSYTHEKTNPNSISNNIVWSIQQDPDSIDILWIATHKGLNKFDINKETFSTFLIGTNAYPEDNQIRDFIIDSNGDFWVGTRENGLWYISFKNGISSHFTHNRNSVYGLSENQILKIFEDKNGLIWIGTRGGELNKVILSKFQHLSHDLNNPNSIVNNTIWSVIEDSDGFVWIGSNGGLNQYNPKSNEYKLYRNDPGNRETISDNYIYSIFEDSKGFIWVGTSEGGLNRFDKKTKKFQAYRHNELITNTISHNYVRSITEDIDGKLWVGCRGGGLNLFDPEKETFIRYKHDPSDTSSLSHDRVNVVYRDLRGNIWIGTSGGGLNLFNRALNSFIRYFPNRNNPQSINNAYVLSICESSDSMLWIGTYNGGLNRFDPKTQTFKHYTEASGLINDVVYGICEDNEGFLWISTNRGLVKFNPKTETFRNFDTAEGIQGHEFNTGAYHKGKSGKMYFGGTNGLTIFHPKNVVENKNTSQVSFTNFKLFNQSVVPSAEGVITKPVYLCDSIVLQYNQNDVTFEFSSMNYAAPQKVHYNCLMVGFDSDWIFNGSLHTARYTNLPPGSYTFHVKSSGIDGIWGEDSAAIHVTVIPPFWKKTWFSVLLFFLILGIIVLIIRLREKSLKDAKDDLEARVRLRTIEIQKQKEEIEAQRDEITSQRDYVIDQRNEIEQQRNSLANLAWELQEKNEEIERQRSILSAQNKEITDSIVYAQRIQSAVLPTEDYLENLFLDFFILYKPKSIVSGDFYWATKINDLTIFCVTDCTGHGVPGAFMSMLGVSFLNEIVRKEDVTNAAQVLNELRHYVISSMVDNDNNFVQLDGMDIGLCVVNSKNHTLQFAGANIPCWIASESPSSAWPPEKSEVLKGLVELKPDRMPIARYEIMNPFTQTEYQLNENDLIYLASDGFSDQFGGEDGKKFQKPRLMELLYQISSLDPKEQKKILETIFDEWIGNRIQIDDVTILGVKI